MNIDPRTLKELLQLQMLNKMDFITGGSAAGSESSGSEFSQLLNSLLEQASGGQAAANGSVKAASAALKPEQQPTAMTSPFFGVFPYRESNLRGPAKAAELDPLIKDASRRNGVQPSLVKAVIDAESAFNPYAVSRAGAKGLMQLMDDTGQEVGVTNPFDPVQNIHGGTRYLSRLLKQFNGNEGVALAAYNAGSGRITRLGITNDQELQEKLHLLPTETRNYVSKVMRLQRQYEA
ncbi:lytic transglycosylase domain-containing protein [Paenibacillus piri]|uniref:Lytic transglycosylase domain-containing protein n=1 Tax=Paenibacillus piri TaxID=2547395 RepID=A0A4R5KP31_9BACL|nr:lytic transglycosylase domain-containing protein [Paenibacillus piri]TDF96715.1 lytic transglycosylase domain-containing protein [Paenibacillus piri]